MGQKIDLSFQVQGILPEQNGGAGPLTGLRFHDNEIPSGAVDGVNSTFTLATAPVPAGSLLFVIGHNWQLSIVDYTLSGATINCTAPPTSGANIRAWYRSNTNVLVAGPDRMIMSDAIKTFVGNWQSDTIQLSDSISYVMTPVLGSFAERMYMSDKIIIIGPISKTTSDQMTMSDGFASTFV